VEIEGFARYNFRERIIVGAELQVKGKRYVKFDTEDLTLPAFSKINLDATYVYDKNLSFYLKLNNLLNTKEYTYLFYKQIGINLGVGISLKF
jgi:outer membrane receptor protein involved in Fe transport